MSVVISDTSPVDNDRVGGYLVPVGTTVTATTVYASAHAVDAVIAEVQRCAFSAAQGLTADKPSGRAEIKSVAHRVARTKTALDDLGKDLVADWKAKSAAVDTQRRRIREALEKLKDDIRRPLTEWEIEEEGRQVRIAHKLQSLRALSMPATAEAQAIAAKLATARAVVIEGFEERTTEAKETLAGVIAQLEAAHVAAVERERIEAEHAAAAAERDRLAREHAEAQAAIAALTAQLAAVQANAHEPPATPAPAPAPAPEPEPQAAAVEAPAQAPATPAAPSPRGALLSAAQLVELREWADGLASRYPAKGHLLKAAIGEIDYWRAAALLRR